MKKITRRQFVDQSIHSAGLCILGGAAACVPGTAGGSPGESSVASPFAYEVDRLSQIDPKLLVYEQIARIEGLGPEPRRIVIGPQNRLYVANKAGVDILGNQSGKIGEIPLGLPARCVAVADDGTVYAGLRTHVEVIDAKGKSVGAWDPPAKRTWLTGLAVGGNDVFAADSAGRVIYRYDRSGKIAGRIGEKSQERNIPGLIVPSPYLDVKLGTDGLLRVNNPGRHCVEVFTTNGDLEMSWGKPGLAIESFCGCCNPVGLALLPDGRCITCEKGLPRVKVFSLEHKLEEVVAGPDQFRENGHSGQVSDRSDGTLGGLDAAVDSLGQIYILDVVAGNVRVMKRKV